MRAAPNKWIHERIGFGVAAMLAGISPLAQGEEFDGMQPVAIDQPRINLVVRLQPNGPVLMTRPGSDQTFNVEAFLDTGASGIILSAHTGDQFNMKMEMTPGNSAGNSPSNSPDKNPTEVGFTDIGVAGGGQFDISQPVYISLADYTPTVNTDRKEAIATTYRQTIGPIRAEVGPKTSIADFLTSLAMGDLGIAGMPAMQGKIVVMDLKETNNFTDKIRTYLFDAPPDHSRPAGVPKVSRHIRLSYVPFSRFTSTTPPDSPPPTLTPNPMIGPNPFSPAGDSTPPVIATHHGKSISGTWLLDTGAAASMISRKQAAALGVHYTPDSDGTSDPQLDGVPLNKQFTMTIGGIGGSKKSAGFYLDKLSLTTQEGNALTFLHAPVLVADISMKDSKSGEPYTLDGVFGMNFLVATAKVDESALLPDIDKLTAGPFRWIVIDHSVGWLGLE